MTDVSCSGQPTAGLDTPAAQAAPPAPLPATDVYLGLGANLGDMAATLTQAVQALCQLPSTTLVAVAPCYRTAPVEADGPDYLNTAVHLRTQLAPEALLDHLQAIEHAHGRLRPYRNAPRTLDIDILCYGALQLDTPRLTLPHPRLHLRAFALRPLRDLAPTLCLPQGELEVLLAAITDQPLEPAAALPSVALG